MEPLGNVNLPTYTSNIQYEGIQFLKRAKNDSTSIVLNFTITDLPCKDVKISLKRNNKSIAVGNPGDRVDVYAERHFDSDGMLTYLLIHLKESGKPPFLKWSIVLAANSGVYVLTVDACSDSGSAEVLVLCEFLVILLIFEICRSVASYYSAFKADVFLPTSLSLCSTRT